MVRNRLLLGIFALLFAVPAMHSSPAVAQAQPWTQVGSLMCKVNPNVGFIIFGHQPMECTYRRRSRRHRRNITTAPSTRWALISASAPAACWGGVYLLRRTAFPLARSPANMSG